MSARSRFFSGTREHSKKDDGMLPTSRSRSVFGPLKAFRRRRMILVLLALWLLYLFFKNMPTDVPPVSERYDSRYGRLYPSIPGQHGLGFGAQENDGGQDEFDGPIKFGDLGTTLRNHAYVNDAKGHVLFAVSNLKSLPHILPIACAMANENRTRVHLALFGRKYAHWPDVRALNGFTENECKLYLHNARPDFAQRSSEKRLAVSARASLGHLFSVIPIRAVIVGDVGLDDEAFVNALKEKAATLGLSLVALPAAGLHAMSWISSLDASSLSHLSRVTVDIVVQAQVESSASLIRLLRSLKTADYTGWSLPRITIELPAKVEPFLSTFLSSFEWPGSVSTHESRLIIRHRVDAGVISSVQASTRIVESFYPLVPGESHVLVVSPAAELSPSYFQLMMYMLLEYKYAVRQVEHVEQLVGFSLELPSHAPDGETLAPWTASTSTIPLLLWQAPTSNAALYFGDRWTEFHSFLTQRLRTDPELRRKVASSPTLSHEYPAWLQPMSEMMQARNYFMLYPTFANSEHSAPATVHSELHQGPEEFMNENLDEGLDTERSGISPASGIETLTANDEIARLKQQERKVYSDSLVHLLLDAVPAGERTDYFARRAGLDLRSYLGGSATWEASRTSSRRFADAFAQTVGGCLTFDATKEHPNVDSLFCHPAS